MLSIKHYLCRIVFIFYIFCLSPSVLHAKTEQVKITTLDNGLTIVVIEDKRAPILTHMVWYKVGSRDDPMGKSGLAHYLEHLMFKGTKRIPSGDFSKLISQMGGNDNAFTSYDYTAYYQKIPIQYLSEVMSMEADRMTGLILNDKVTLAERAVVLQERAKRVDSNPFSLLKERIRKRLHSPHPYSIPIIGWRKEIEKLSIKDALTFYRRFYTPNNAILLVVGDTDLETVKTLAKRTYGKIRSRTVSKTKPEVSKYLDGPAIISHTDPTIHRPIWTQLHQIDAWSPKRAKEFAALDILIHILAGDTTSRLYKNLVLKTQQALSINAFANTGRQFQGEILITAFPSSVKDIKNMTETINNEFNKIKHTLISQEELSRSKVQLLSQFIFNKDTHQYLTFLYGGNLSIGIKLEDIEKWSKHIQSVTAKDVQAAARTFLLPNRSITGHLLPQSSTMTTSQ